MHIPVIWVVDLETYLNKLSHRIDPSLARPGSDILGVRSNEVQLFLQDRAQLVHNLSSHDVDAPRLSRDKRWHLVLAIGGGGTNAGVGLLACD